MRDASKGFERFRGKEADYLDAHHIPSNRYLWELGQLEGVLYRSKRDGKVEHYQHKFRRNSQPKLAVSADGKTLYILGGRFEVTDRGIEDKG